MPLASRIILSCMVFSEVGLGLGAAWAHNPGLMGTTIMFATLFYVLVLWGTLLARKIVEVPIPHLVPEPYPADKKSHDYQMGYKDGKGDEQQKQQATGGILGGTLPAGHPANPGNSKKPLAPPRDPRIKTPTQLRPPYRP